MRKRLRKKKIKQVAEEMADWYIDIHPLDAMIDILQGTKQVMNGSLTIDQESFDSAKTMLYKRDMDVNGIKEVVVMKGCSIPFTQIPSTGCINET